MSRSWTSRLRPSRERSGERADGNGGVPELQLRDTSGPTASIAARRARRLLQPAPLAGVVLILVAVVGYWSVYSSSTDRTSVLISTRELPAGATLQASDVRAGELAGDASVMGALVAGGEIHAVAGRRLATPVTAGAPLPRDALAREQRRWAAFTLVLPIARAVGGSLQAGDRVTVMATFGAGGAAPRTRVVARALQVLDAGSAPAAADRTDLPIGVTVALTDPSLATELALANDAAELSLLLEGSGRSTSPIPSASEPAGAS